MLKSFSMKLTNADVSLWLIALALYALAWFALRRMSCAASHSARLHALRAAQDARTDTTYVGYIGLATIGFFWRVLFAGAFVPAGGGDMAAILYPIYHFAQENLRQGIIPLWNPHLYAGIPFVGHIQSGPFYPPNLLLFLLTPEVTYRSLEYLLIAHFWLAGVLMYVMLRNLDGRRQTADGSDLSAVHRPPSTVQLSRPAALLGALVFMFNDFNLTHIGNPNMVAVGAWLPLALLLFHLALARRRMFYAMLGGAVTGMAYLAGHIQPFLYILFAVGLYALYFVLTADSRRQTADRQPPSVVRRLSSIVLRPISYLLAFLAFTVLIAAISLVPNLEMSAQSLRESLTYADAAAFSLPPAQMVGLFVPGLFGRGPDIHWGPWERVEVGYVGILPLILAALALMWRRERTPRFFVLLALVSFVLATGLYGVVHGWLFLIPGYSQIRVPARFVFLLDFAIAALAAYGFDTLLRPLPLRLRKAWRNVFPVLALTLAAVVFVFIPLMFVAVALNQSQDVSIFNRTANGFNGVVLFAILLTASLVLLLARRTRWLSWRTWTVAMVVFVFADLASLGAYLDMGESDPTANFNHPQAVGFLRNDHDPFRIETPEDSWFQWQPNLGLVAHLDDAAGIYNPLLLQRYARYWHAAIGRDNVLYDLLNTKYLVVKKDEKVGAKFTLAFDGDPSVNIWQNQNALPRAFMLYQSKFVKSADEAFDAITSSGFDPQQTIVLETADGERRTANGGPSVVKFKSRGTNFVEYEVTSSGEGYLFTGDTYYPGWRAILDGIEAPLLRADYLFRAVKVPAGNHEVELIFDPLSWKVGVAFTTLGVIGLLVGGWLNRRNITSAGRPPTRKSARHV